MFRGKDEDAPTPPPKPMGMSDFGAMYQTSQEEKENARFERKLEAERQRQDPGIMDFLLEEDANEKVVLMGITFVVSLVIGLFYYYILYCPFDMPWYIFFIFGGEHVHKVVHVTGNVNEVSYTGIPLTMGHRLETGWNIGASSAILVDGEEFINIAAGGKYRVEDEDYDIHTLQVIFSSGKVLESIAMAILQDRGLIDISKPISTYWPEFGKNGKEKITTEQLLSHRAGLGLSFNTMPSIETLHDNKLLSKFLEDQHPLVPVGTVMYSGWFSALYTNQICMRVDPKGRSLVKLLQQDVFAYLRDGELYSGPVPEDVKPRLSPIYEMPHTFWYFGFLPQIKLPEWLTKTLFYEDSKMTMTKEEKHMVSQMMKHEAPYHNLTVPFLHIYEGVDEFNDHSTFLGFESLSVNAISNSHSMALALEWFAHGGLVSEETLKVFTERLPREFDTFLGMNMTYTRGGLAELHTLFPSHAFKEEKHSKTCIGWAGLLVGGGGGSMMATCVVEDHNVTFAYTSNRLTGRFHDWRSTELLDLAISGVRHKKYADFFDDTHAYFKDNHEPYLEDPKKSKYYYT